MGIMITSELRQKHHDLSSLLANGPTSLIEELVRYRQQNEALGRLHDLHRHLSEKLDLASMVEAISIWLTPLCPHELLAYAHPGRNRGHTSCSRHGPERRTYLEAAQRVLQEQKIGESLPAGMDHLILELPGHADRMLVIFAAEAGRREELHHLLHQVSHELRGPLDRALAYEDLYDQARRDALTGLANRRVFEETASREMANAYRYRFPLTLAVLDLDHFKAINDYLGHGTGDSVLQEVAKVLKNAVRDSDHLARVGGDEFILLMPNTREEDANGLCQRLCALVGNLCIQAPGAPPLGVSIGISRWHEGESMVDWMERADAALYRAKSKGRSQASLAV